MDEQEKIRKQQEEQAKAQRRAEITAEIGMNNGDITTLKSDIKECEKFKSDMEKATAKLYSAANNINKSNSDLIQAYKSSEAAQYKSKLIKGSEKVKSIAKKITGSIIPEVEEKIKRIEKKITEKQNRIKTLQNELNSL